MDIVGALEASGDGNRKSQVSDEGMEERRQREMMGIGEHSAGDMKLVQ